jgi:hypothetical protein
MRLDERVVVKFFLGEGTERPEDNGAADVVQLPVQDNYANLTLKTLEGLSWATGHYQFRYFFKVDDDSFVWFASTLQQG